MSAIVFQNLGFDLGPRKLVVFRTDRKDLPHLTISWSNPTGEVDIHLTPPFPKDSSDRYSIIKIQEAELGNFLTSLGIEFGEIIKTKLLRSQWPVRPIWLGINGYMLVQPKDESLEQWLERAVPKLRGKRRFDVRALKHIPRHALYHPTSRRLAELKDKSPLLTICTRGWDKGRILILNYSMWRSGRFVWVAMDYDDMSDFDEEIRALFSRRVSNKVSSWMGIIYQALYLNEVGL